MKTNEALNVLRGGKPLVASILSSRPSHLAWLGVYPLDMSRETTHELLINHRQPIPLPTTHVYRIRAFEVDRSLIERDASIAESHLENKVNYFAFGEDELIQELRRLGVLIEQLELPYKTSYPI